MAKVQSAAPWPAINGSRAKYFCDNTVRLCNARGTTVETWFEALEAGLAAVAAHRAEALVVALGVDTFEGDPISGFHLRADDYLRLGERLARAGLPVVLTMEGGYAVAEVGVNVVNVLEGFRAAAG